MKISAVYARIGLGAVAAGGITSILFGGRHALEPLTLGRLFVLLGLCYYAGIGRRWAAVVLAVLIVGAVVGLVVGAVNAGLGSRWGTLFLVNTLPYVAGLWLFFGSGGTRATKRAAAPSTRAETEAR